MCYFVVSNELDLETNCNLLCLDLESVSNQTIEGLRIPEGLTFCFLIVWFICKNKKFEILRFGTSSICKTGIFKSRKLSNVAIDHSHVIDNSFVPMQMSEPNQRNIL